MLRRSLRHLQGENHFSKLFAYCKFVAVVIAWLIVK
jgi:hypothetical protein